MTRLISSSRHVVTVLSILALMLVGCGGAEGDGTGGTAGSGGTRGTAGSGGTGGTVTAKIDLPECALRGYYILYGELWGELQNILVYLDRRIDPPEASGINTTSKPIPHRATLPHIEDLADPQKKKPRVAWKSFSWEANPDDPVQGWETRADFYQGLDESIYGVEDDPLTITINEYIAPSFYLDLGFYNTTVAVVDWRIVALGNYIGKGTFSINGLDNDVVRVTIVRFPECAPEPADSQPALCADPPPGDLWYDLDEFPDIPWYDEGRCRFDLTSFGLHVDVRTIGTAEPFAVVIGFKATIPGHVLENGSITVSPEGVSSFTGTYDGQPASFDYDPDTGEVIITFTGEPETRCTLDSTDSVSLVNCE